MLHGEGLSTVTRRWPGSVEEQPRPLDLDEFDRIVTELQRDHDHRTSTGFYKIVREISALLTYGDSWTIYGGRSRRHLAAPPLRFKCAHAPRAAARRCRFH
ncbi:hypothetical protein EVAR_78359_1 [Eumeta japonica]|uniref:Uncharacterized protein n=1 Tax=Eumeta variegata TaxID=151549 RepID=A0A4C1T6A2_EUMVA|nr:hypothetical protein EVAR_78359_1 [Eumeta japonica]